MEKLYSRGDFVQECGGYSNLDALLDSYWKSLDKLLKDISEGNLEYATSLWNGKYVTCDKICEVSMDKGRVCMKSHLRCVSCKWLLPLLTCGGKKSIEEPFTIEVGRRVGRSLILRKKEVGDNGIVSDAIQRKSIAVVEKDYNIGVCGAYPDYEVTYVTFNPTSCNILIHLLVGRIITYTPQLYGIFRCGNVAYVLEENTVALSEVRDTFTDDDISDIIVQLIMQLKILSAYAYSHSCPCIRHLTCSVIMQDIPEYDTVKFNSRFRVGIDVGDNSSMTVGKTRIVSRNPITHLDLDSVYTEQWRGDVILYKIVTSGIDSLREYKKSGIPIYTGSIDLYCFLLSLYIRPDFRKVIDERFPLLWINLLPMQRDAGELQSKVQKFDKSFGDPHHAELLNMLSNMYLRCDAITIAWDTVRDSLGNE